MLYAMTRVRSEDSMTFVRLRKNPMSVKKTKAVSATPRKVDDNGVEAEAGYD